MAAIRQPLASQAEGIEVFCMGNFFLKHQRKLWKGVTPLYPVPCPILPSCRGKCKRSSVTRALEHKHCFQKYH